MAIKIVFPTHESVPHSGGQRLLEIEADALDDLNGLSSRVDDGVRTFYAAPGSMARAKDGSAVYEYGPAGGWMPQGSGSSGPSEVVILPETVFEPMPDEEGMFFSTTPLSETPTEGAAAKVTYNGTEYSCTVAYFAETNIFLLGNIDQTGVPVAGGNPDAPFVVVLTSAGVEGVYGTAISVDGATSVTLSIVQVGSASPDWNQNDPTAADYVKNRTHYSETTISPIFKTNGIGRLQMGYRWDDIQPVGEFVSFEAGVTYQVTRNGVSVTVEFEEPPGNSIYGLCDDADFYITANPNSGTYSVYTSGGREDDVWEFAIVNETVHTIDPKFLPGGGSASAGGGFVINATMGELDETLQANCTCDKTFEEAIAAVKAGQHVVCHMPFEDDDKIVLTPMSFSNSNLIFSVYTNGVNFELRMFSHGQHTVYLVTPTEG